MKHHMKLKRRLLASQSEIAPHRNGSFSLKQFISVAPSCKKHELHGTGPISCVLTVQTCTNLTPLHPRAAGVGVPVYRNGIRPYTIHPIMRQHHSWTAHGLSIFHVYIPANTRCSSMLQPLLLCTYTICVPYLYCTEDMQAGTYTISRLVVSCIPAANVYQWCIPVVPCTHDVQICAHEALSRWVLLADLHIFCNHSTKHFITGALHYQSQSNQNHHHRTTEIFKENFCIHLSPHTNQTSSRKNCITALTHWFLIIKRKNCTYWFLIIKRKKCTSNYTWKRKNKVHVCMYITQACKTHTGHHS